MTVEHHQTSYPHGLGSRAPAARPLKALVIAGLAVAGLASCGGSDISNPEVVGGKTLSFAYFQKCINPIFLEALPIPGTASTNTCAAGGCHDSSTGSGGALRVLPGATDVNLTQPVNADAIRKTENMYKNFISAQGQVVFSDPAESRLIAKPLVQGVLHGGGRIFANDQDVNAKLILYWMSHPAAQGQDEFSAPAPALDPLTGKCSTQ